jgi:glucose-1-phosphatase
MQEVIKQPLLPVIKNIVFDFGGVILNIDHYRVAQAFRRLGISQFDHLFNLASQSELFKTFEKGEITPAGFRNEIRKLIGLNLTDATIDHTWNEIICDYPPKRIELLKEIKNNYNLFILSNTNIIHYNYYIPRFRSEFGFDFVILFNNTYWSFKIGMRKPDPDPFLFLIRNENIQPKESLFIDDTLQNIVTANNLGFYSIHLQEGMEITDLFRNSSFIATNSLFK